MHPGNVAKINKDLGEKMKCENCKAVESYWNGNEEETYCAIGVSEDEACHDGE